MNNSINLSEIKKENLMKVNGGLYFITPDGGGADLFVNFITPDEGGPDRH